MSTTYKDHTITLEHNTDAESPRDHENLGILVASHKRYVFGDPNAPAFDPGEFTGWGEVEQWLRDEHDATVILPVYMYDHSGTVMSTVPFSCPWDSGQIGFIYTTAARIAESGVAADHVEDVLRIEIAIYDLWSNGEVYGYIVEDADGVEVDSCWGYYGEDDAMEQAKAAIDHLVAA